MTNVFKLRCTDSDKIKWTPNGNYRCEYSMKTGITRIYARTIKRLIHFSRNIHYFPKNVKRYLLKLLLKIIISLIVVSRLNLLTFPISTIQVSTI